MDRTSEVQGAGPTSASLGKAEQIRDEIERPTSNRVFFAGKDDSEATSSTTSRVSIILPIHDGAIFVNSALSQILAQTHLNWELIVILDGADNETQLRIAATLAQWPSNNRISVYLFSSSEGVAASRNFALRLARGKYVWFTDVDDRWRPNLLARLCALADTINADLVLCGAEKIFPDGTPFEMDSVRRENRTLTREAFVSELVKGNINGHLWNKLFSRELLGEDPFPRQRSRSDLAGVLGVADRVNRVGLVDEVLYSWCLREGSVSNSLTATPGDILKCGEVFERMAGRLPDGMVGEAERLTYLYRKIYLQAILKVWRFGPLAQDGAQVELRAREKLTWRGIALIWRSHDYKLAVMVALVVGLPGLSRHSARVLRMRRWRRSAIA